mgnify:CR=1 FL=1
MRCVELQLWPEALTMLSESCSEIAYVMRSSHLRYGLRIVATEGRVNDWAAYVCSIEDSGEECERFGDKLSEETATLLFPWMATKRKYRR